MRRRTFLALSTFPVLPALSPRWAAAQEEAPALSVAAGGLVNPRGFAWDEAGALVVAEAGTGGEAVSEEVPAPTGAYRAGATGRVSRIEAGCPASVAEGLPSAASATGETIGVADVVVRGGRTIALVAGGGAAHGNPDAPAGLYDVTDGAATLLADLGGWARANPVAAPPPVEADPDGVWSSMAAAPEGDAVWVVDRNGEQIVRVSLDGEIARVVDLSADDTVPTALAVDATGALHVGLFTASPYEAGSASVLKVSPEGATETVWSGLTMVGGLAFGPDGTLYATEFSSARERPPFFVAATGRVVRQTGPDAHEEVVTRLNFPTTLRFGPDEALYISEPGVGADDGTGVILRADLSGTLPLEAGAFDLTPPACSPAPSEAGFRVSIFDFGFDPSVVTIPVGSTVTWVNDGAVAHTSVAFEEGGAKTWDSDILESGDEYSFTFTEEGTFDYVCGLHPAMTGVVEVVASGP